MNIRQLRKNLKIPIRFSDTEDEVGMALCLIVITEVFSWISVVAIDHLANCYESNLRSQFPDGISAEINLHCGHSYDQCLCSNQLNNSSNLTDCVSHIELIASRISPSIIFILECFLVWKLFSFNANCSRVFVRILWILSILILVGITIGTYLKSCFHRYIFITLPIPRIPLWPAVIYNLRNDRKLKSADRRNNLGLVAYGRRHTDELLHDNGTTPNNEVIPNNGAKSFRELL